VRNPAPSIGSRSRFMVNSLQMAPALDFGLVSILWEALEVFRGQLFGGRPLPGEFFADERVYGHGPAQQSATRNGRQSARPL